MPLKQERSISHLRRLHQVNMFLFVMSMASMLKFFIKDNFVLTQQFPHGLEVVNQRSVQTFCQSLVRKCQALIQNNCLRSIIDSQLFTKVLPHYILELLRVRFCMEFSILIVNLEEFVIKVVEFIDIILHNFHGVSVFNWKLPISNNEFSFCIESKFVKGFRLS